MSQITSQITCWSVTQQEASAFSSVESMKNTSGRGEPTGFMLVFLNVRFWAVVLHIDWKEFHYSTAKVFPSLTGYSTSHTSLCPVNFFYVLTDVSAGIALYGNFTSAKFLLFGYLKAVRIYTLQYYGVPIVMLVLLHSAFLMFACAMQAECQTTNIFLSDVCRKCKRTPNAELTLNLFDQLQCCSL